MIDVDSIAAEIARGMIPAYVYSDPEVFALEKERLFAKSWVFLGHESEVPATGDFVVRRVLDDSYIMVRDDAGHVRVHFNMCIHRGMQVCRSELGNASHFRCPYHGWSYRTDGTLGALPFHGEAYGGDDGLARANQHLLAPTVDTYRGFVFINLEAHPKPLAEFLGEFTFYLDFYAHQSEAGLEFRGPQRWRVNANWKIGCENFVGDMYHTPYTHASVVDISLFREPKAHKRKEGALYWAGKGGGTTYKLPPGDFAERMRYVGYPDEMITRMAATWSPAQKAVISNDSGFIVSAATAFPNMSLVHNWPQIDSRGTVVPFISVRQWQPISSTETEVMSWFAVDSQAPEAFKEASYKAYLMCFGTTGMFEQDDVENWVSITSVSKGTMARSLLLNTRMGLTSTDAALTEPLSDFAGPGTARVGYAEFNQRNWLTLWATHLSGGPVQEVHPLGRPRSSAPGPGRKATA